MRDVYRPLQKPCSKKNKLIASNSNAVFIDYLNRLENIYINRFEWKNLPETIDPRLLEITLCEYGHALFFIDDIVNVYLCMAATVSPPLSLNNIPKNRRAFAPNGFTAKRDNEDSVIIYDNYMRTAPIESLWLFAQKLWDIDRAITVNINAQKTPYVFTVDEEEIQSVKTAFRKISDNEPIILGTSALNASNITTLNTQATFVARDLQLLKLDIWNEFMCYCGYESNLSDKKERVNQIESNINMTSSHSQRYVALNARQQAANDINKMFNLNIEVFFRDSLTTISPDAIALRNEVDI